MMMDDEIHTTRAGSNQPDIAELLSALIDDMKMRAEPIIAKANTLVSMKAKYDQMRPELETEEHVARATELAKALRDVSYDLENVLKGAKKAPDDCVKAMRQIESGWQTPVTTFMEEIRARINRYQTAKLAKERAEKAKREEEARKLIAQGRTIEAAQKLDVPPPRAATRTDHGSLATTSTSWTFTLDNPALVPRAYCSPDKKLIDAEIKHLVASGYKGDTQPISGITISEQVITRIL